MRGLQLYYGALLGVLTPSTIFAGESEKVRLRRQRIAVEIGNKDEEKKSTGTIGDLWELEAAQADVEAVRFLQSVDMSITNSPTTNPPEMTTPSPSKSSVTNVPTGSSCLSSKTKKEFIFEKLLETTPRNLLSTIETPQGKAFDWLVSDGMMENPCEQEDTIVQRFGAATFFFATNGEEWTDKSFWLSGENECEWFGIECDIEDKNVVEIELPSNNLQGTIPEEISGFKKLENLGLFANSLEGSIPKGLEDLTQLILIDLERNLLTGDAIPDFLSGLTELKALRLSRNGFGGTIPNFVGQWTKLQQMWLGNNKINGPIPTSIGALTDLENIFLYGNQLDGTIPSQMGQLTKITNIRLDNNFLSQKIPNEFYNLDLLQNLRLDYNDLTGEISPLIGQLTNLVDLRLNRNNVEGALPVELAQLTKLQNLIMFDSSLNGKLPNIFEEYTKLEHLDLSNNKLTGTIPRSLFDSTSLRLVYLSNNTLGGSIPNNFQDSPVLRDLWLDGNQLTGEIPEAPPGRLRAFNEFLVQNNKITGTMPPSICALRLDAILDDVFSDCGVSEAQPEIECPFPDCCNRCFENNDGLEQERRQLRSSVRRSETR